METILLFENLLEFLPTVFKFYLEVIDCLRIEDETVFFDHEVMLREATIMDIHASCKKKKKNNLV